MIDKSEKLTNSLKEFSYTHTTYRFNGAEYFEAEAKAKAKKNANKRGKNCSINSIFRKIKFPILNEIKMKEQR